MRTLFRSMTVNGKKEPIPAYPSPKYFVYSVLKYFNARSLFSFFAVGKFILLREMIADRRNRVVVPRMILLDPTNACNMHCKGCWAGDYKNASHLSYERWDSLIGEAKQLGTSCILYTGGEPMTRSDEIISIAQKYKKMFFGIFTNASLVDEVFIEKMQRCGNIMLFISIEGYREETDFRRGAGAYDRTIRTMQLLKRHQIPFAFSLCYHKKNYQLLTGKEYLDFLREQGAWMGWAFAYRPIGQDADTSLVLNAEERFDAYRRFQEYSKRENYPIIDLFNSGHKAYGCVAGGDGYLHINADGDVEPCAFCHYSDANINDMSLREALQSPFLRAFRREKTEKANPFAPCPAFDKPEQLVRVCLATGASSTHTASLEPAEEYAAKAAPFAKEWSVRTNDPRLWGNRIEQWRYRQIKRVLRLRHYNAGDIRNLKLRSTPEDDFE